MTAPSAGAAAGGAEWVEAAGAGRPAPAWAGGCGRGAGAGGGGAAPPWGGRWRGACSTVRTHPPLPGAAGSGRRLGKVRRVPPGGVGGGGMRALPGSSSRSIPLPERGRPEGTPGLGRARLAELPGSRDERLPERRGRARREGSGAAGERRCPWVCAAWRRNTSGAAVEVTARQPGRLSKRSPRSSLPPAAAAPRTSSFISRWIGAVRSGRWFEWADFRRG